MAEGPNATLVRRFNQEVLNDHKLDELDQFYAPDFKLKAFWHNAIPYRGVSGSVENMGLAQVKQGLTSRMEDFPHGQETIDELIEAGDRVVVLSTFQGTSRDGKSISVKSMYVLRFVNGKITEQIWQYDRLGQWQQLGIVPETSKLVAQLPNG